MNRNNGQWFQINLLAYVSIWLSTNDFWGFLERFFLQLYYLEDTWSRSASLENKQNKVYAVKLHGKKSMGAVAILRLTIRRIL